jgi:hypothetical protein
MKKVIDLVSQLSLKFYSQHVISTVSPAQEGEIEINTQSKNRFYGKSLMDEELCLVDNCTINSIFRETIFSDSYSEVQKCFNHRWTRYDDSWLHESYCNTLCYDTSNYLLITFIRSLIKHQVVWLIKF